MIIRVLNLWWNFRQVRVRGYDQGSLGGSQQDQYLRLVGLLVVPGFLSRISFELRYVDKVP